MIYLKSRSDTVIDNEPKQLSCNEQKAVEVLTKLSNEMAFDDRPDLIRNEDSDYPWLLDVLSSPTRHNRIYYDKNFINKINHDAIEGLIAHELVRLKERHQIKLLLFSLPGTLATGLYLINLIETSLQSLQDVCVLSGGVLSAYIAPRLRKQKRISSTNRVEEEDKQRADILIGGSFGACALASCFNTFAVPEAAGITVLAGFVATVAVAQYERRQIYRADREAAMLTSVKAVNEGLKARYNCKYEPPARGVAHQIFNKVRDVTDGTRPVLKRLRALERLRPNTP